MSIHLGKVGYVPNWISDHEWSAKSRIEWINTIMATSSRDWSILQNGDSRYPDPETWAIWCLACYDTKKDALSTWNCFCKQYERYYGTY